MEGTIGSRLKWMMRHQARADLEETRERLFFMPEIFVHRHLCVCSVDFK